MIATQPPTKTKHQSIQGAIALMSYVDGKEAVTHRYILYSDFDGRERQEAVGWNPEQATADELNRAVLGDYTGFERVTVRQTLYVLVDDNGKLLARRGGRDFWALPPWQYDRFGSFVSGMRDTRLYLEPVMRKTEKAMRQHQERVGGRVAKVVFGVDRFAAPLSVVFLD